MLYAVADADWSPGSPPGATASHRSLHRTRAGAARLARGRPTLAVALIYDPTRGAVVAHGRAARDACGGWTAPALIDATGGVTVLAPIPEALVRAIEPATIRIHAGATRAFPRPRIADLVGQDRRR